jgi:ABC-type sugar transport system substrate-binding protein
MDSQHQHGKGSLVPGFVQHCPRSSAIALVAALLFQTAPAAAERDPRDSAAPGQVPEPMQNVIAFEKAGTMPSKHYKIAYVTECVTNAYCEARMKGLEQASKKYGFEFKTFDSNFNPQAQLKDVQNAAQQGFDGYLFGPTADAPACKMWKDFLVPTKKPVVTVDLSMCGDVDYTPGLAAMVSIQRQPYYDIHVEHAFAAACGDGKPCKGISLSGFAGSDLFTRWEMAIDKGLKKFPNVQIVSRREAKFDPRLARQITQDALQAHPDLNFVVSHDDNMSLGVAAAIKAAGLTPGKDVKIYSMGGNAHGVDGVKQGIFEVTTAEDPQAEAYYGALALVMAMEGHPLNGYVNLVDLPWLVDGTDTIFITKQNMSKFTPHW